MKDCKYTIRIIAVHHGTRASIVKFLPLEHWEKSFTPLACYLLCRCDLILIFKLKHLPCLFKVKDVKFISFMLSSWAWVPFESQPSDLTQVKIFHTNLPLCDFTKAMSSSKNTLLPSSLWKCPFIFQSPAQKSTLLRLLWSLFSFFTAERGRKKQWWKMSSEVVRELRD